ncbi:hypothetical protein [Flavobacterium quisquiliarum]|uniref:Lipoprotein n=1 Tax=Flavobacterium quisquiliarum TaxID=1834436 RepID=A0ABV8W9L9_9FLAO|nr:hypothetical protein [Flavobacterium quisquiliarum]MBW1657377.1 hypothetical protein [Flavobacterium quisquiliarum]NWL01922.1 hypothetical protein [Flavobacterium collinsii]
MKSILYAFLSFLLFSSCASFSDKMVKDNKENLSENDLSKLEGTYELFPDLRYNKKGSAELINSQDSKVRRDLNYFVSFKETKQSDFGVYLVDIKFISGNKLKFTTKKDNVEIESFEVGGKLKKGLFYLDNRYLKRNGIPYLAGGYTNYKTRIGLAKDNGLLVNYAYDNSGAILFLFWAGSDYNLGYHYKRIEK